MRKYQQIDVYIYQCEETQCIHNSMKRMNKPDIAYITYFYILL